MLAQAKYDTRTVNDALWRTLREAGVSCQGMPELRTCDDASAWDALVCQAGDASVLQAWAWGSLKSRYGWGVQRYFWSDRGVPIAGAAVLRRSLPGGLALNYAPRGPILNGRLDQSDVRGKVVLVDFYTFDCINCKHVVPELRKLRDAYRGADLAIVGVHAPELPQEHIHTNVVRALQQQDITWPVIYDDQFKLWNAYGVQAWPTQLVFDRHGKLRATYVGEGYAEQREATVRMLVAERRSAGTSTATASPRAASPGCGRSTCPCPWCVGCRSSIPARTPTPTTTGRTASPARPTTALQTATSPRCHWPSAP